MHLHIAAHRRRANDVRLSTETRSRRSVQPVCSASSWSSRVIPSLQMHLYSEHLSPASFHRDVKPQRTRGVPIAYQIQVMALSSHLLRAQRFRMTQMMDRQWNPATLKQRHLQSGLADQPGSEAHADHQPCPRSTRMEMQFCRSDCKPRNRYFELSALVRSSFDRQLQYQVSGRLLLLGAGWRNRRGLVGCAQITCGPAREHEKDCSSQSARDVSCSQRDIHTT